MAKLNALILEVIHFNTAEDVIVTSGNGLLGKALIPDTWYVTIGSELIDNSITSYGNRTINNSTRYWFRYSNNSVQDLTSKTDSIDTDGKTYAWFFDQWRTGDLPFDPEKDSPDLTSFDYYYTN